MGNTQIQTPRPKTNISTIRKVISDRESNARPLVFRFLNALLDKVVFIVYNAQLYKIFYQIR